MKIRCSTCDELHDLSEMDVGYERPDPWYAVHPDHREERWEMDSDLAILDRERFFIRGLVYIPVHGEADPFAWGVWAAVDERDYRRYDALYDDPERDREPPFAGRIANQLPGYPQTLGLPVTIRLGADSLRPSFQVDEVSHPLAVEQRKGVYLERVLEMVGTILHRDGPEPRGAPRFATGDEDRWRVLDVKEKWLQRSGIIWFSGRSHAGVGPGGRPCQAAVGDRRLRYGGPGGHARGADVGEGGPPGAGG